MTMRCIRQEHRATYEFGSASKKADLYFYEQQAMHFSDQAVNKVAQVLSDRLGISYSHNLKLTSYAYPSTNVMQWIVVMHTVEENGVVVARHDGTVLPEGSILNKTEIICHTHNDLLSDEVIAFITLLLPK